jgi:hypothetical protein
MRALGITSVAAALCVCCVLPSFDAVDRLPGDGSGAESSAGSNMAGSNTTLANGGKSNSGGSGTGAEGGEPGGIGEAGSSGTEPMAGSGGSAGEGGSAMAGSSMGGAAGSPGSGGGSGSGGTGGGAGTGGSTSGTPECAKLCQGANGLVARCEGYLEPVVASEAGCLAGCNNAPVASLDCWQYHLDNVVAGLGASVHCPHASGKVGNGACPERPAP